jgi:hypothetical protein
LKLDGDRNRSEDEVLLAEHLKDRGIDEHDVTFAGTT